MFPLRSEAVEEVQVVVDDEWFGRKEVNLVLDAISQQRAVAAFTRSDPQPVDPNI